MFEINLIKDRIIPAKQKNIILGLLSLYILIWVLSVAAVAFLHIANVRMIEIYKGELAKLEREISATYPGLPTAEELKIMWNKLLPELTSINRLLRGRILWAPKLNQISRCLREGVWIDEIRSEQKVSGKIIPRERGKNKRVSIKSPQQALVIEGRVLSASDKEGIKSVEDFVSNLKKNVLFMEDIEGVELVSTKQTATGAKSIIAFKLLCRFNKRKGF